MIGAGTFINPLLKIVTTVAILAAAYFFIVRPILDTTETAFQSVGPAIRQATHQAERVAARQGVESFQVEANSAKQAEKILDCVQEANGNVARLQRCTP